MDWGTYERRFLELLERRQAEKAVSSEELGNACLLCSESTPEHCHRRLVAEYLVRNFDGLEIRHL